MLYRPIALLICLGASLAAAPPPTHTLLSPDGKVQVKVQVGTEVQWSLTVDGRPVVGASAPSLTLEGQGVLGAAPKLQKVQTREADLVLRPVVRQRRAEIRDAYRELQLDFKQGWSLVFRASDDGVAYRFLTRFPGTVKVLGEQADFRFTGDHGTWFPEEKGFQSHQERLYVKPKLSEIGKRFASLPLLVDAGGLKVALTEADLFDYPGMNLQGGPEPFALRGLFPAYPKAVACKDDRNEVVTEREPYLAVTQGTRAFPWRVLALAREDRQLLSNDLVYRLASETEAKDTAWIKPGKVAWDWWHANVIYNVDFRSGVNTATYKHYIDFAAQNGLQYVILDEGWYPLGDLLRVVPEIDMPELLRHAKAKGVGLILWCSWKTLDQQFQAAFEQFERWGIAGIKVDFMQREDQWMVRFYERVAREALKRHLLVDFHGSYKPTGLRRTFPNVLTHEGVKGLEQSKWGEDASPENAVTFPYIRMLAGPADYTPGAMRNAQKKDFKPIFDRPMSQGTRCQQLAMYVAFESPLQMLADSPAHYDKEPECLSFLAQVPCVWDETVPLSGAVGQHLAVARRSGDVWYAGALTNWTARTLELDLSFLKEGRWNAEIFQDGPNADRVGEDYQRIVKEVQAGGRITLKLAPGGGWVARFARR